MSGRFIIVAEREERVILPIIHGDDSPMEGCLCVYNTRAEAEAAAANVMACRAFGHTIIDLDDLP